MGAKGFTLIEVLIAMLVLSISFMWLLKAQGQGVEMAMRSKFLTTSTLLAQKHVADVRSSDEPIAPGRHDGDFGEDYPGYHYVEDIEATPMSGYYKYTLNIYWGPERGDFETEFISFILE